MKRILAATTVLLSLAAAPAAADEHVRVVLDLSKSMLKNDPGRMALLSTVLLHDLARPNSTQGDTFKVIPFAQDWRWSDPAAPPPMGNRPQIVAVHEKRADFVKQVLGLSYDANMTYFYPGLLEAVADLERTTGSTSGVRAIVLVTDGVPESKTRDRELELIQKQIGPRLGKANIRLYVLAFGTEAFGNQEFFRKITTAASGPLGEPFFDPQGRELLSNMLTIFSRTFGYSKGALQRLPGARVVDLEGSITPETSVAVVLSDQTQAEPSLRLTPPAGGAVSSPDGVRSAAADGGSYSLQWVLSPNAGPYSLDTSAVRGSVAVLRPVQLTLEVLPVPPRNQTERAIAGMPFPLIIRVKWPNGAKGAPNPVDLSFRTVSGRFRTEDGKTDFRWKSKVEAPPAGQGNVTAEGREYNILVNFAEHPEHPEQPYAGYLKVYARNSDQVLGKAVGRVVGSLEGDRAHRVEVHPRLAITPVLLSDYAKRPNAAQQGLGRREEGCADVRLEVSGYLPHSGKPSYPLLARITATDPAIFDRELRRASFTLDGKQLEIEGKPADERGPWSKGLMLTKEKLEGNHKLCVRVGRPTVGNPAAQVSLAFTLQEDPYDDFGVVKPFVLKVPVAEPTFLERWKALLLTGLALLVLAALLWYSRARPGFPPDMAYAVGREDAEDLVSRPLEEGSPIPNLLGLVAERPVIAGTEDRLLGRVRPVNEELYQMRPARGFRVEPVGREEPIPMRRGLATLAARRLYRLRGEDGSYLFRLEYQ